MHVDGLGSFTFTKTTERVMVRNNLRENTLRDELSYLILVR